jgi:O-acetyl-ADP-ribose deacetylase (regulator of RNase III)
MMASGGNLKAKRVVHTVGPIWRGGHRGESSLLAQAYMSSLRLAVANKLRTMAFSSISTGAYGYPIDEASRIAVKTVKEFLEIEGNPDAVFFVLFSESDFQVYFETESEFFATI